MHVESKNQFVKIQGSLIRIAKIDAVKKRHVVKANNFGKVTDEFYPEIIISVGADKHVFFFENETEQAAAFDHIQQIITDH